MENESDRQKVAIIDFNMPFGSMVLFMIKWAIASIPALVIVGFIYFFFATVVVGCVSGIFHK